MLKILTKQLPLIFFAYIFLASITWAHQENNKCHPAIDPRLPQYIVGYGSLLQSESKHRTSKNSEDNLPVIIHHVERAWMTEGTPIGYSAIFLGARAKKNAHMNGIIFKIFNTRESINAYDAREVFQCRHSIDSKNIQMLNNSPVPKAQFWIYMPEPITISTPNKKFPIVQSYVDIFISGCLEIQDKYHLKNFAEQCIDTTKNWSAFWVNDRIYPRRPFIYVKAASRIDALLARKLPQYFDKIKIE